MNKEEFVFYISFFEDIRKNISPSRINIVESAFSFLNGDNDKISLDNLIKLYHP